MGWSVNPNSGVTGGDGTFTFPQNTTTQDIVYIVTYTEGNKKCSKTVTVKGIGSTRCCENIEAVVINTIPSGGTSEGNVTVATVTSVCPFSNISVSSPTIGVTTSENSIVVTNCSENTNSGATEHNIYISYSGSDCKTIKVIQNGAGIRCDCSDVYKMIAPVSRIYDNNAHSNIMIASADTQGCGEVSASTDSTMLVGGELRRQEVSDGVYKFWADIAANTTGQYRTADINVYFKKKSSSGFEPCDNYVITILQTENPPSCTDIYFSGSMVNGTISLLTNETKEIIDVSTFLNLNYTTSFTTENPERYYACELNVIEGDINWIEKYSFYKLVGYNFDYLNSLKIKENTSTSARTLKLLFKRYHSVIFVNEISDNSYTNEDWVGGNECGSCTVTITQPGVLEECDCGDYELVFTNNIGNVISQLNLNKYNRSGAFYVRPQSNSSKPCPSKLSDRYTLDVSYVDDGDFITGIESIGYKSDINAYEFHVTVNEKPRTDEDATITVCLIDTSQGEGVECICNDLPIHQEGLNNCTDCDNDVKANITAITPYGKVNGGNNLYIIYVNGSCAYEYRLEFCDVNGNTAITPYDWISDLVFHPVAITDTDYVGANIEPNFTNASRTAYIKVTPLDENGNELIPGCSAVVGFTQGPMNPCNCSVYSTDKFRSGNTNSSTTTFYPGQTNQKFGEVTIYSQTTTLDCTSLNITTTQGNFITNLNAVFNRDGRLSKGADGYIIYRVFDIIGDIQSGITVDEGGQSVSFDWHLYMNGEDCLLNGNGSIIIENQPNE